MSAPFADHFSQRPDLYARARPRYPDALFEFIASQAPALRRAWDCATGNGQAALGLARHFEAVEATDASAAQIANALQAPRVRYSVQPAERTDFEARSFDAVCVAQALHWFDLPRFHAEAKRVLRPGGIVAAWGYDRMRFPPALEAEFARVVLEPLEPHWPAENRKLWGGYRDVEFPYQPIEAPELRIEMRWTLRELMDYVATWSATRRLVARSPDFIAVAERALEPAWGRAERVVAMPMHLRCGRHG